MTKVINLFGAPGTGKSTLAAGLFYRLKLQGINCELASEYIKEKFFEDTPYPFKDQLYVFAKQNKKLRQLLGKVDYIICDSPILQGVIYGTNEPPLFQDLLLQYFNSYDNINYLLKRTHAYHTEGRIQTEQEADKVGELIKSKLDELNINYIQLPTNKAIDNICKIFNEHII